MTDIFLHIPKAAGTSLGMTLMSQYGLCNTYRLSVEVDKPNVIKNKICLPADNSRCVMMGHFSYGVADLYSILTPRYFTMLREPFDRLFSHYNFVRTTKKHNLHRNVVENQLSFEQYIKSGITLETSNGMVRQLSGHSTSWDINPDFEMLYSMAIKNLDAMCVFGLAEEYEKSLFLFADRLGWNEPIALSHINKTRTSRHDVILTAEQRNIVLNTNQYDIWLYEYARTKFFENCINLDEFTVANVVVWKTNVIKGLYKLVELKRYLGAKTIFVRKKLKQKH